MVLILIGIILGVNAWRNSSHRSALRDYARQVTGLARQSQSDVSRPFFALLTGAQNRSPFNVETQVNELRVVAEDEAGRARQMSVPGDVVDAQRSFVLGLDLRAETLRTVADQIRSALGSADQARAIQIISGGMQALVASDVLYAQRVVPLTEEALRSHGVFDEEMPVIRFMPNLGWLNPAVTASRLGAQGAAAGNGGPIRPGTHGHGLTGVSVGNVTLQSGVTNRIPATSNPVFTVRFQNQGTNDEFDVAVTVTITGAGQPITVKRTLDRTTAGQTAEATIPLGRPAPTTGTLTVTATIQPVPGEKVTSNNHQSYSVVFVR